MSEKPPSAALLVGVEPQERADACTCEIDRHDFDCPMHNEPDHPKRGPNGDEP